MESNQKKNIFLVGTICVLAVLAVTMMIGTKNQWWDNPYSPKKVDQGYEQVHHHEQVRVASPKCPKYQDMDGNCLDKCGGLNTAVGKVYRKVERKPDDMDGTETDFLEILTKHEVYSVCYCRGFSCDPVTKPRTPKTSESPKVTTPVDISRAGTIKMTNSDATMNGVTPTVTDGKVKASEQAMLSGGVTWGAMETVKMK